MKVLMQVADTIKCLWHRIGKVVGSITQTWETTCKVARAYFSQKNALVPKESNHFINKKLTSPQKHLLNTKTFNHARPEKFLQNCFRRSENFR